jgi:hypothetical protein
MLVLPSVQTPTFADHPEGMFGESNLITLQGETPMPEGEDIIIRGGSVELTFDDGLYIKDSIDPTKHKHPDRKIMRVQVADENGGSVFDSDINKDGLQWTITVSTFI